MNYELAHSWARQMSDRLYLARDFFERAMQFDHLINNAPDEYEFAIKNAIVARATLEPPEWMEQAREFLADRGIDTK